MQAELQQHMGRLPALKQVQAVRIKQSGLQGLDINYFDFIAALDTAVVGDQKTAARLNGCGVMQGVHQAHVLGARELRRQTNLWTVWASILSTATRPATKAALACMN